MNFLSNFLGVLAALASIQALPTGLRSQDEHRDFQQQIQRSSFEVTPSERKSRSAASQFMEQVRLIKNSKMTRWSLMGENGRERFARNMKLQEFNVDQADISAIETADEIVSFTSAGHPFSDQISEFPANKQFWYDVSDISPQDQVYTAELRLWKKRVQPRSRSVKEEDVIRISLYQIVEIGSSGKTQLVKVDERKTKNSLQGWLRFDITSAFKDWIVDPKTNYGLVISTKSAKYGKEVPLLKVGVRNGASEIVEHQPFMVAFLKTVKINPTTADTQTTKS